LTAFKCFSCGKEISHGAGVSRRDECPHCRSDVHVCKNCQFYDSSVYNECRETQADVVREKDRSNFCDFFQAGSQSGQGGACKNDLMTSAEALFKKKV
jgi:hypothetical protein